MKSSYKEQRGGNEIPYTILQLKAPGIKSLIQDRRCLCSRNTYKCKQNTLVAGLPKLGKAGLLGRRKIFTYQKFLVHLSEKSLAVCCHRSTGGLTALTSSSQEVGVRQSTATVPRNRAYISWKLDGTTTEIRKRISESIGKVNEEKVNKVSY